MPRYKLILSYDGTDYAGWQIQPNQPSIEQIMRESFTRAFSEQVSLLGASRTDAGVHALGQVVLCVTPLDISPDKCAWVWNRALPSSIVIRSCERVDDQFHPHVGVQHKTYWYTLFSHRPLPHRARYGWYCPQKIDLDTLKHALDVFVGRHDFRAFCKAEDAGDDTVRTIYAIDIHNITFEDNECTYRIVVRGDRFMRHMIRRIVGAAVAVAIDQSRTVAELQHVRNAQDPNHTLPKAPAGGLLLHGIQYQS